MLDLPSRIKNKIIVNGDDKCWGWNGALVNGYAVTRFNMNGINKIINVTRIIMNVTDSNIYVCHTCDNRECLNPKHLFLGSNSDNIFDCVRKNRHFQSKKLLCKNGHIFDDNNTYIYHYIKNNKNYSRRVCKKCNRLNYKEFYKRSKNGP